MRIRGWYGVATTALVWALYILLGRSDEMTALLETSTVGLGLRLLVLLSALSMPIFVAMDWRSIGDDVPWDPSVGLLVIVSAIWVGNIAVGLTYCIRRDSALRGTVPSGHWIYGVVAGPILWVAIIATNIANEAIHLGVLADLASGPLVWIVFLGYPAAMYLDIAHVRAYTDWSPSVRFWVIGSAVPLVNVFAGLIYAFTRRIEFSEARSPETPTADDQSFDPHAHPDSPWYRRIATLTFAYFVLFVVLADNSGSIGIDLPVLLAGLWVPFGLAIALWTHRDIERLAEAGLEWGPTRYLYLTAAVFPPTAFVYLLRRITRSRRHMVPVETSSPTGRADESATDESATDARDDSTVVDP